MNFEQAMAVIQEIQYDTETGLLETLQYMDRELFRFNQTERAAFRVVMTEMRKLFIKE